MEVLERREVQGKGKCCPIKTKAMVADDDTKGRGKKGEKKKKEQKYQE